MRRRLINNKKGISVRTTLLLIIGAVTAVIVFYIIGKAGGHTTRTLGGIQQKIARQGLCGGIGTDYESVVSDRIDSTDQKFLDTVNGCGYCIEKDGDMLKLHFVDTDSDGIPDKCEHPGSENDPAGSDAEFKNECNSGYYTEYDNPNIGAHYWRCCIGFTDEDKKNPSIRRCGPPGEE